MASARQEAVDPGGGRPGICIGSGPGRCSGRRGLSGLWPQSAGGAPGNLQGVCQGTSCSATASQPRSTNNTLTSNSRSPTANGSATTSRSRRTGWLPGKGVILPRTGAETFGALEQLRGSGLWQVNQPLVIEERLDGWEASVFALADGKDYRIFAHAQDYKRAYDGDEGPNTGGMGAVSPSPLTEARIGRCRGKGGGAHLRRIGPRRPCPTLGFSSSA